MSIDWAYKLKAREERGEKLCIPAQKAWREVLAKVPGALDTPPKKEVNKVKQYKLS